MLLWDYEMTGERVALAQASPLKRLSIALQAVEWTYRSMNPPISDSAARSIIERGLAVGSQAVADGNHSPGLRRDFMNEIEEVDDEAEEPGVTHFMSAIMEMLGCPPDGLSGEGAYGILSYCYEGALEREDIPEVTPEAERGNRRCVEMISFQKELISRS